MTLIQHRVVSTASVEEPVLSVKGLTVAYRDRVAIRDVDFDLAKGERLGIVGPNGAGKTTLIRCLAGLLRPSSGSITVGAGIRDPRRSIAYLAQRPSIEGDYPAQVRDIVAFGRFSHRGAVRRLTPEDRRAVAEAIDRLGLTVRSKARFSELSGGLQQRVLLAKALAQEAPILLLDEVHAGLDLATIQALEDELSRLCAEGKTVIVVQHGLSGLLEHYDRLLLLRGRVVADGPPRTVLRPETLAVAFGEDSTRLPRFGDE